MTGECKEECIHFYLFIKSFLYARKLRLVLLFSIKLHLPMHPSLSFIHLSKDPLVECAAKRLEPECQHYLM